MKIISCAWTTPALISGHKTCTRRDWNERYARGFKAGDLVQAYDRSPRNGGRPVAIIRLTADPEYTSLVPDEDWRREGFEYLRSIRATVNGATPLDVWASWRLHPRKVWVARFEMVPGALEKIQDRRQEERALQREALAQNRRGW